MRDVHAIVVKEEDTGLGRGGGIQLIEGADATNKVEKIAGAVKQFNRAVVGGQGGGQFLFMYSTNRTFQLNPLFRRTLGSLIDHLIRHFNHSLDLR